MSKGTLTAGRPSSKNARKLTLSSMSDKPSTVRVNFDLSSDEHKKLKIYAAKNGTTIRELFSEYVAKLPKD